MYHWYQDFISHFNSVFSPKLPKKNTYLTVNSFYKDYFISSLQWNLFTVYFADYPEFEAGVKVFFFEGFVGWDLKFSCVRCVGLDTEMSETDILKLW